MAGRIEHGGARRRGFAAALAATLACLLTIVAVGDAQAATEFGIKPGSFTAKATTSGGDWETRAGAHPHSATTRFELNTSTEMPGFEGVTRPVGSVKDIVVDLPPGFVGNPQAVAACDVEKFSQNGGFTGQLSPDCPPASQVGVGTFSTAGFFGLVVQNGPFPVYNLAAGEDEPAAFGFNVSGNLVTLRPTLRSDGDYGLRVSLPDVAQGASPISASLTFWGVPADPSHDAERAYNCSGGSCKNGDLTGGTPLAAGIPRRPFLTNPTDCTEVPRTTISVASWENPGRFLDPVEAPLPPPATGCERLRFEPTLELRPTTTAPDSPTGLSVELAVPQNDDPDGLATPSLKDAVVRLPEGMTVSPAAADGLEACTDAQVGLRSRANPTCPLASKIGTVTVDTPLLAEPLRGSVYVGSQTRDQLLRLFIVVKGKGVIVKIAGRVDPDPVTGRLTATFEDNPQLPFSRFALQFKDGPRAPLATPATCGTKTTTADLTPWAGADATPVTVTDSFTIDCAPGLGAFAPGFTGGTVNPIAGRLSPLVLAAERPDGQQRVDGLHVELPSGLAAKLKGVPLCGSADAVAGTCPVASRIGTVTAGAGVGPNPFLLDGTVSLTEGYKGAPYGLSVAVPAVAGPFDLGMVVVRQAVDVNPTDAHITTLSDPIPTIVKGIPVRLRSIHVAIDRPGFAINPTSCTERRIGATLHSSQGATFRTGERFQVGDCAALPFKPKLALRLTGRRQRTTGRHPGVKATVTQRGIGEAGIRQAVVQLPKSLALDPSNAQALCEFEDGTRPDLENRCPRGSIVGRARAVTPLLNRPLAGNVYFVKNVKVHPRTGNRIRTLPMVVVALRGEIAINLRGESSTAKTGELVNTFASVPDAPITRFDLAIKGGNGGILAVTRTRRAKIDLCSRPKSHLAEVEMDGQNGKRAHYRTRVKTPCAARSTPRSRR